MDRLLDDFADSFLIVISTVPFVAVAVLLLQLRRRKRLPAGARTGYEWVADTALLLSSAAILAFTLAPTGPGGPRRASFELFSGHGGSGGVELLANIALFVPFGGAIALRGLHWRLVVALATVFVGLLACAFTRRSGSR